MSQGNTTPRPQARIAKGFRDIEAAELSGLNEMLTKIRGVYERYGFEALETPAIEYTDALGKFLPDQDRPNAGVFSFQDEDEQWMSLRYDLTAPLARYVAQNYQTLPKPFRRYAFGTSIATKSRDRDASASLCSSTPIRWVPKASPPTQRCACWRRTRWKRSASSVAIT